jgi:kynureninase
LTGQFAYLGAFAAAIGVPTPGAPIAGRDAAVHGFACRRRRRVVPRVLALVDRARVAVRARAVRALESASMSNTNASIRSVAMADAVAALGPGPLTEAGVSTHIAPLFSRVLAAQRGRVYLANHSLGRPLDAVADDVQEAINAWYARMGNAWTPWNAEIASFRSRLASLLGGVRPDSVIPKTSAGQGLRAVLNSYDSPPRVVATRGEFDSLDVILREYARRKRVGLTMIEARPDGHFDTADILARIGRGTDLVVLSEVIFTTGQRLADLPAIVAAAHTAGARVLLDVYHSLGVFPVDLRALDVDFAVGGSYKYLRGGPGACFLYAHPRHLDAGLRTLDTGWFAKQSPFEYERPDPPRFAEGGDGWLESTPAVLPFYQARSGLLFTLAIGVARLRSYSWWQQAQLVKLLELRGIASGGGRADRGAFVVVRERNARAYADALRARGVDVDARGEWLRLCPDLLTTMAELDAAATALATVKASIA